MSDKYIVIFDNESARFSEDAYTTYEIYNSAREALESTVRMIAEEKIDKTTGNQAYIMMTKLIIDSDEICSTLDEEVQQAMVDIERERQEVKKRMEERKELERLKKDQQNKQFLVGQYVKVKKMLENGELSQEELESMAPDDGN